VLNEVRYQNQPALIFFEKYILQTIGHLPKEQESAILRIDLQKMFNIDFEAWQDVIRYVLELSDTIDIAILDAWIDAWESGYDLAPKDFVCEFSDNYFAVDSDVDVWLGGQLDRAIERIEQYLAVNENGDVRLRLQAKSA